MAFGPVGGNLPDEIQLPRMGFQAFDEVGRHLDRRIDGEIETELFRQRRCDRHVLVALQRKHARRVVHRARQHAGIDQRGVMFRTVVERPPRIVFLPPRAFPGDPVGIGAPEACILYRLMRVDGDPALRRFFHHQLVVLHLPLPVVPFEQFGILVARIVDVRIAGHDPAGIRDIAGLDPVDAEALVKVERVAQLFFVIGDVPAGFMVPDDPHPLRARIRGHVFEVEIGIILREAEFAAIVEPVAVPADVPAFDQDAAKAVLGGKIDILLRALGRGTVTLAGAPGPAIGDHAPPDTDIFRRLHPSDVAQPVRLVEV